MLEVLQTPGTRVHVCVVCARVRKCDPTAHTTAGTAHHMCARIHAHTHPHTHTNQYKPQLARQKVPKRLQTRTLMQPWCSQAPVQDSSSKVVVEGSGTTETRRSNKLSYVMFHMPYTLYFSAIIIKCITFKIFLSGVQSRVQCSQFSAIGSLLLLPVTKPFHTSLGLVFGGSEMGHGTRTSILAKLGSPGS